MKHSETLFSVVASIAGAETGLGVIQLVHPIFDMLHPVDLCCYAGSLIPVSVFGARIMSEGETSC